MNSNEILAQLTTIFKDVLDNDSIVLTPQTTAKDIDEWDSLSYIQLIHAIEKHFKIRFTITDIQHLVNIGSLIENIEIKLKG